MIFTNEYIDSWTATNEICEWLRIEWVFLFFTASLIRTFMFLGFQVVVPGDPIVPIADDLMFLAYTIDHDSDDDFDADWR